MSRRIRNLDRLVLYPLTVMLALLVSSISLVGAQEPFLGNPPITPRWAFEPWVWEDDENSQSSTETLVQEYQNRNIPVGAVIIDSPWSTCYNNFLWDGARYPSPQQMINNFHAEEVRVIMWLTGFVNETSTDTPIQECPTFEFVGTQNYAVDGGDVHNWWKGNGRHVDFTNAEAKDWWHTQLDNVLSMGIDGWKADKGATRLGDTVVTSIGNLSKEEFRRYYYADTFDYTTSTSVDPLQNKITFARPIGTIGANDARSETLAPISKLSAGWGGDYHGDFDGLRKQKNHLYRSAQAGYGAPGIEVGGYMGPVPTKQSLIRYSQLGALTPIMENGGSNGGLAEHLPWYHDEVDTQTVDIYRYYATLHSELTPFLFSYGVEGNQTGESIIRGSDETLSVHRLGEELFVSVITEGGDNVTKTVTFPSGSYWIS